MTDVFNFILLIVALFCVAHISEVLAKLIF